MATLADTYSVYIKESLDGRLIIRKKTTKHVSPRVEASKERVARAKPGAIAERMCIDAGYAVEKKVYKPGEGYITKKVCPMRHFRRFLREAMARAHGRA